MVARTARSLLAGASGRQMPCVAARPCSWVACTAHGLRQKTGSVANSSSRTPNRPNRVARPSLGALPRGDSPRRRRTARGSRSRSASRSPSPSNRELRSDLPGPSPSRCSHTSPASCAVAGALDGWQGARRPLLAQDQVLPTSSRAPTTSTATRRSTDARTRARTSWTSRQSHVCGVVCGVVCWREWRPESCWRAARIGRAARATVPV